MENLRAEVDALFSRTDERYFVLFQLVLDGSIILVNNNEHMADTADFGHEEGTEYQNEHGTEVVVYDYDEEGNVTGWHKELQKDG